MRAVILIEILAVPADRSRGRHNPRVVKRKMSNFPTKARAAPGPSSRQVVHYQDHIRVIAPLAPRTCEAVLPAVAAETRPEVTTQTDRQTFWLEHVRAWRASSLSRTAYCQRHGLELRSFHQWVARLRQTFRRPTSTGPDPA
jgi:hypothetical protein